jgi:hypothetical protein
MRASDFSRLLLAASLWAIIEPPGSAVATIGIRNGFPHRPGAAGDGIQPPRLARRIVAIPGTLA